MPFGIPRRTKIVPLQTLPKRDKDQHASLRHFAARVNLVNQQLNLPFSALASPTTPYSRSLSPSLILATQTSLYRPSKILSHSGSRSIRTMSDDAYSSFLDKANQDTGASKVFTQSESASIKVVDTEVPATLQQVEQYYVSEADEPFEPVSLKWGGENMPSESTYGL